MSRAGLASRDASVDRRPLPRVLASLALGLTLTLAGPALGANDDGTPPASRAAPPVSAALRAAARGGDAQAQYDLGAALGCGRGARVNLPEAARWFAQAALRDHVQATATLGWMYMVGQGVRRDDAEALRLLAKAADLGNTSAQNNLGIVYAQGRGVPVDRARAELWFRRAAENGAPDAARNLEALISGRAASRPTRGLPDVNT